MARQGQSDIEIADETFKECWDQFQNWAARHISETLRFDQLANLDDEDEEELDESLFQASLQSGTAHKVGQELRALYYDPVEIDLEDELLEPTVGPSPSSALWMNRFTTKTIPQYSSFSHLRQQNYIRGDIWVQTRTGERIRVATGDDEEIEVQVQAQIEDEKKKRGKGKGKGKKNDDKEPEPEPPVMVNEGRMDPVDARRRIRKQKLVNLGAGDNPANNQESMPFIPPEMKRRNAKNIMLSYEASFLDIEAWQHFAVGWTMMRILLEQKLSVDYFEAQEADNRRGRGPQTPRWRKPTVSAHKLLLSFKRLKRARCGNNCFSFSFGTSEGDSSLDIIELESEPDARVQADADKYILLQFFRLKLTGVRPRSLDIIELESEPDARVQADIETIWRVDPDAMPCDVAELSWDKVTCRQAYDIRNRLYSDLSEPEPDEDHPEFEERRGGGSIRKHTPHLKNAITLDLATRTLTALAMLQTDIAFGTASVTPRTVKIVFSKPPGTDTLRAGKQRRRGCDCKADSKTDTCRTEGRNGCKCYNAEWSVTQIFVRGAKLDGGPCMNVGILMKQWKQTVVKPSQYGNGLFLVGNVVKNTLISDYTGDICLPRTALRRSLVADATHRNYLFDIPNYSLVIWNGNELFLHYGSRYWNSEMPGGEPGAADPGEQDSDELGSEVDELYDESKIPNKRSSMKQKKAQIHPLIYEDMDDFDIFDEPKKLNYMPYRQYLRHMS
ncbi:SET domain-containing protein [Rhizoctonia solani]|uniref:SET domain-containing protein n=1 Tax=Rhizoctonia solani TaxID=456999 RepID=A0A8H8P1U8_9AGAM|nr:SET domain-containing protein [Rhizoctonia solani]QRW22830.1 SET domain-containing protein [Rhizoctonia solani]